MRSIDQTTNQNSMIPRAALIGAGFLILSTLVGVGLHQLNKPARSTPPAYLAQSVKVRQLRFIDQHDGVAVYGGSVRVIDANSGIELAPLAEKEGFVRAVLNSLSFERGKRGATGEPVFELTFWSDNRITLSDPASGASISVGQFGAGNKAAFMRFFDDAGTAR